MLLDYGANPNAVSNNNRVRKLNSLLINLCKLKNAPLLKLVLNHEHNSIDLESVIKQIEQKSWKYEMRGADHYDRDQFGLNDYEGEDDDTILRLFSKNT